MCIRDRHQVVASVQSCFGIGVAFVHGTHFQDGVMCHVEELLVVARTETGHHPVSYTHLKEHWKQSFKPEAWLASPDNAKYIGKGYAKTKIEKDENGKDVETLDLSLIHSSSP